VTNFVCFADGSFLNVDQIVSVETYPQVNEVRGHLFAGCVYTADGRHIDLGPEELRLTVMAITGEHQPREESQEHEKQR
jgi:hypothetical protein